MRRAVKNGIVSRPTTSATPAVGSNPHGSLIAELDAARSPATNAAACDDTVPDQLAARRAQLALKIRTRIESRLGARVRNLVVRLAEDTVVLEGQCATYYSKQLAQHAALGILEDEHLENAIVVDGPQ